MAKVNIFMKKDGIMKASFSRAKSMEKEGMSGKMEEFS